MAADKLLATLLRSLQTYTDQQDTPRLLSTAASLLNNLQNPLNISLLTSQLLTAPALWHRPEGLQTCLRLMGVFHSAAVALLRREDQDALDSQAQLYQTPQRGMEKEAWVRAVMKGTDEKSATWKHTIVAAGILLGFGPPEEERLGWGQRHAVEQMLVQSVNVALTKLRRGEEELGAHCIVLVLNHTFAVLPDFERSTIDYDMLLPVLLGSAFFSNEGLQGAYFLGSINLDIVKAPDGKLNWRENSPSFHHITALISKPLISHLGPLSRLISHAVENVRDPALIITMLSDLQGFTKSLITQWVQIQLAQVDQHEESQAMTAETVQKTMPQLWKLLRSCLFGLTIVFRGAVGRLLNDPYLASDAHAPEFVISVLHSLRNLYFITSRIGTNSFSQYTFVYLTCIDVLSRYPRQADNFLRIISPTPISIIPSSPLDRALALFFLNTSEHFTLILSPTTNEAVLVAAALPYLSPDGRLPHLMPIFEAAHSVFLAVLSAPQQSHAAEVTAAKHAPFYVDALFGAFPTNLSPRQFRLAFKTLMRVATTPSSGTAESLAVIYPNLPAVLCELVRFRALSAGTNPLPQQAIPSPLGDDAHAPPPMSEQAALVLTLLDALPYLPLGILEDWLQLAAETINVVPEGPMRDVCRARIWEVLVSGEMDPDRAMMGVAWWSVRGGREFVMGEALRRPPPQVMEETVMSGALPPEAS